MMKRKKVMRDEHGPRHVTPSGRSVFYDLFPKAKADELVMRKTLLRGPEHWLKESGLTQTQAAKTLSITRARVSDIKCGKILQFSLGMLVRLASRAGLKPSWNWRRKTGEQRMTKKKSMSPRKQRHKVEVRVSPESEAAN
jgi:predicted XRE-type DNA-binding protein